MSGITRFFTSCLGCCSAPYARASSNSSLDRLTTPAVSSDNALVNFARAMSTQKSLFSYRIVAALGALHNIDCETQTSLVIALNKEIKQDPYDSKILWCLAVLIQEQNQQKDWTEEQKVFYCINLLQLHSGLSGYQSSRSNIAPSHKEDPYQNIYNELTSCQPEEFFPHQEESS